MAISAPQIQFRNEFIATFEQKQSLLRRACTSEAMIKGNQARFLVAGSGNATAVTRGVNGLIPARTDSLTQSTATLEEWHDLVQRTGFDLFASQGDGMRIMQMSTLGVVNRKIDTEILSTLAGATNTVNSAAPVPATFQLVGRVKAILGNNEVPFDGNLCFIVSPAFEAYMSGWTEFSSADYANVKQIASGNTAWNDEIKVLQWYGFNWIVHPNLTGVGTTNELCYAFHKSAIGHAMDVDRLDTAIGRNDEQSYNYCRVSTFQGSVILQQTGILKISHDGSAFATS